MGEIVKHKLPTVQDLVNGAELSPNDLTVILNAEPPARFVREHPAAKIENLQGQKVPVKFIPREHIEYMLTRIYGGWQLEIKSCELKANSMVTIVRLYVTNPITGAREWHDGVGAAPIQTDAGKGAVDFNFIKAAGVQMAAPASETYAFKDAAEKFGKIFGKDLNVKEQLDYSTFIRQSPEEKQAAEEEKRLIKHLSNMKAKGYDIDVILMEIGEDKNEKARELWKSL